MAKDLSRTRFRPDQRVQVPYGPDNALVVGTVLDPRRAGHVSYWLVRIETEDGPTTIARSEDEMVAMAP